MYRIICSDGTVLYDQSNVDSYPVLEAKSTREVGQPGSLSFIILPGHPAYNMLASMETYLYAEEDGEEIFYGRIIDINIEKTTGQMTVQCAGALNFLDDSEVAPFSEAQNMTCLQFLQMCLNSHNSDIDGDAKRTITLGTVSHSSASELRSFQINSYTKTRSAIDTYLIKDFGGFVRVRKSGNGHVLDWVEDYNEPNTSPITLGNNVVTQENSITANDLYTVIRPSGKDGITLPGGTVALSNELVSRYGRIVRSVGFSNATTVADLQAEVTAYIARLGKGAGKTATVNVFDMHFLDGTVPRIRLGAVYTNISGFENEPMMVATFDQNFTNPAEDSVTLKNERELSAASSGSASGRGSISNTSDGVFKNIYNHIVETQDSLKIHADLIGLYGHEIEETAAEFQRYSAETTQDIQVLNKSVTTIRGTAVLQNSDHIAQVAGNYIKRYRVVTEAEKVGRNPSLAGWYLWSSTGHTVVESDIGSGIELYSDITDALVTGQTVNTSNIAVGEIYGQMYLTNHETPNPGTTYYTRTLGTIRGTEVFIEDDGQEVNVVKELKEIGEFSETVEGSTLWIKKDDITGFVGEFEIDQDPQTGTRTLICKAGGGMKIERNNVEYGIYDEGNLTGGIIVDRINGFGTITKIEGTRVHITAEQMETLGIYTEGHFDAGFIVGRINDQTGTIAKIVGDYVDITATQVKVGSTSNVKAWMDTTDQDITRLDGLVTDKATIAQLNTQTARIDNIAADYINSTNLYASIGALNSVSVKNLTSERGGINVYTTTTTSLSLGGSDPFTNCIKSASVDQATNTLTLTPAYGDPITFSKAIAPTLSGSWSSGVFTVTSNPSASNSLVTSLSGSGHWGVAADDENVNTYYLKILGAVNSGDPSATGYTREIDASGRYTAGSPVSGTVGSRVGSTYKWSYIITKGDGTTATINIDSTNIYADARVGYTQGTFTKTPVLVSGSSAGICYPVDSKKGTKYYKEGTARTDLYTIGAQATAYSRGTRLGVATNVYNAGTEKAYTLGDTVYQTHYGYVYNSSGKAYSGYGYWFFGGNYSTLYAIDKEKTVQGSAATGLYVASNSGAFYLCGGEVKYYPVTSAGTITPIATGSGNVIQVGAGNTYYNSPTNNTTDYWTKS